MDYTEEKNTKNRLISLGITIGIHALLLVLLSFLMMEPVAPSVKDDGIPVLLEEMEEQEIEEEEFEEEIPPKPQEQKLHIAETGQDQGLGSPSSQGSPSSPGVSGQPTTSAQPSTASTTPKPTTSPKPTPPSKQAPTAQPAAQPKTNNTNTKTQINQNREPSVTAHDNAAARKQAEEAAARRRAEQAKQEAERKAKEAAARKAEEARQAAEAARKSEAERKAKEAAERKAAEEKRKADAAAVASGRAGRGFGGNNRNQGTGGQGNSNGTGSNAQGQGVGGIGTSAKVGSRRVLSLPAPQYTDKSSQGTVVVSIIVNKAGSVKSASIASGNTSQALKNAALAAAKKAKFSAGDNDNEKGTITYNFRIR